MNKEERAIALKEFVEKLREFTYSPWYMRAFYKVRRLFSKKPRLPYCPAFTEQDVGRVIVINGDQSFKIKEKINDHTIKLENGNTFTKV